MLLERICKPSYILTLSSICITFLLFIGWSISEGSDIHKIPKNKYTQHTSKYSSLSTKMVKMVWETAQLYCKSFFLIKCFYVYMYFICKNVDNIVQSKLKLKYIYIFVPKK